jgi:plasmid stabilization system protein ParE
MAVKIRWSSEAEITFFAVIHFLEKEWTEREVRKFVQKANRIIGQIQQNPGMYKSKGREKVRRAVVNKQNSLFYFYDETENIVLLLTFWDNRKNPSELNF